MCGKFGHYVEGCPEKEKQHSRNGRSEVANDNGQGGKDSGVGQHIPEGPWTIVKKMRHPRRGKERGNGDPNLMHNQGSRFRVLSGHQDEDNQAGVGKQPMVPRVNEMRENLVTMEIKDGQLT